jgi:inorganic pyrophosphatase
MTDCSKLPLRDDEGHVHVVVETPRGGRVKYKYDPALKAFALGRPLEDGLAYPFDWGFVPQTQGPDDDPLDAMILHDVATFPGLVVPSRPVAVLEVRQTEHGKTIRNDRVLFTPAKPHGQTDLDAGRKRQLEAFFLGAVAGTGKKLEFLGWGDAGAAEEEIERAAQRFRDKLGC